MLSTVFGVQTEVRYIFRCEVIGEPLLGVRLSRPVELVFDTVALFAAICRQHQVFYK